MKPGKAKSVPVQRERPRYSPWGDLSITFEGSSHTISLRTPDISTRGMFINTSHSFPQGTVLKITLRLPRTGYTVRVRAEVRYCLEGVGIGVEFVDISPEAKAEIEKALGPLAGEQ